MTHLQTKPFFCFLIICFTGRMQHIWFSSGASWGYFSTSHLLTLNLRHLWGVYCKRISFKERCLFTNTRCSSLFVFDTVPQKIQQVQAWWQSVRNMWSLTSVFIELLQPLFTVQRGVDECISDAVVLIKQCLLLVRKRFSLFVHVNSVIACVLIEVF